MSHARSSRISRLRPLAFGVHGAGALIAVLWALSLAASAAYGAGVVGGRIPFDLPEEHGFPRATYYRLTRPDLRLCPSPMCGGVFVERVNRELTKCAEGHEAQECYAATVDFSRLDLPAAEEERLRADFSARRALVRGGLEMVDAGGGIDYPTLVATEAWRGISGSQSKYGRYFGVFSTGIVCITHPCPSFAGFKLNGRSIGWLHSVDFQFTGATPEQITLGTDALHSGPGLIGFGMLHTIKGPAGRGQELRMTEFYTRVEGGRP